MKKSLPIGKDDFQKLIMQGCYYVDKTRAIEELLDNNTEVSLFPRPRRFGKTLFMLMLENFFEIKSAVIPLTLDYGLRLSLIH